MDPLLEALQALPSTAWAAAVHIGAGHGAAVPALRRLEAERLVLLEGDPDSRARLTHRSDLPAAVRISGAAVGPEAGKALWNRYTLSMLNGPLDAAAWTRIYPRLRLLSSEPIDLQPVAVVLTQALEDLHSDAAKLLVLDLPGQEDALLAAVPHELLRRFDWIVVRGCTAPPGPGWVPGAAAVRRLTAMGYAVLPSALAEDPLWTVVTLRFDAAAFRLKQLEHQVTTLEEHACKLEGELAESRAQHAKSQADWQFAKQRMAELEGALTQARTATTSLETGCEQQARLAAERQARVDAFAQEVAGLTSKCEALTAERSKLIAARDEHAQQAQELKHRFQTLQDEAAQLRSEHKELAGARSALNAERDALNKGNAQLTAERDALAKERPTLIAARDEQTKAARDARQKLAGLEAEMAELLARHTLLQEELIKAEAQIELIADVLLREPRA